MSKNLYIKNGRIIDPASGKDQIGDLFVQGGLISDTLPPEAEVIDATGLVVTPGLIDIHVHLREPGQSHKETIETGTRAAAAGGFTTVVCMPNTTPAIDSPETVTWIQEKAKKEASVNVYCTGAMTLGIAGKELAPLEELAKAGIVAFTDDGQCIQNNKLTREAVKRAHSCGLPIMDHCQEATLTEGAVMNEGACSKELGVKGWPCLAEDIIVARNILLAEEFDHPIHCQHISSKRSVQLLREARRRGVPITAEACPHHLCLTDDNLKGADANQFKVNPPLRTQEDIDAVIEGIADGTITILSSDHAPHATSEKEGTLDQAAFGMMGLETELATFLTVLFHNRKVLSLPQLIGMLTANPAELLKLDRGTLNKGAVADITLIDPECDWTYDKETSSSLSRNTPFHGHHFKGRAVRTIVGGTTVWKLEK